MDEKTQPLDPDPREAYVCVLVAPTFPKTQKDEGGKAHARANLS